MSTLRIPSLPQIDEAQRMRDARTVVLQRVVARNADLVFDTFIEGLKVVSNDPNYPLAQMLDDLEFGPMEDRSDLDGWLKYAPTRDKVQLGEAIMRAAGEAQLTVIEKLLDAAFKGGETPMATKTRKSTKGRAETIATCGPCQWTYIMCGTPGQLRRERALRCGRCKGPLQIMAEVERQR